MAHHPEEKLRQYGISISEKTKRKAHRLRAKFEKKYRTGESPSYPLSARDNSFLGPIIGLKEVVADDGAEAVDYTRAVFIGTIRMGYGHYRIGMALASAAHALGYIPYWHDLLNFDSAGARMIRDLDKWYSLGSRLSQKSKLFNRFLWDPLMGKWYKRLEKNFPVMEGASIFADTHAAIPPETPFLATHPFNAHGALHAGLNRVVNVVPDNCPLGFHVAPGALHTVQSPSAYFIFRSLRDMGGREDRSAGMPAGQVQLTGHYVDHELVANIDADCNARLTRMREKAPRRLLVSIGGAGAQQDLLVSIIHHLMPDIRSGKVALFVNCGDHTAAFNRFIEAISGFDALAEKHFGWEEIQSFVQRADSEAIGGLHVFLHDNPFVAVYTTNMLMRVSDILLTKPSELAFYPIPKLMLERVGGHEAWGAIRAAEQGDGTAECAGAPFTEHILDVMIQEDDLFSLYCAGVMQLRDCGIYDGAYRAVRLAATGCVDG